MVFDDNAFANRRRFPREAVMLAGSAMSVTRSRSVMIADLSSGGGDEAGEKSHRFLQLNHGL